MDKTAILLGKNQDGTELSLRLNRANRHGLVAGATGTGKTVTLRTLVKGFAERGVTVFAPDVKGDLNDISKLTPTRFLDIQGGGRGDRVQVSVLDLGPVLFSRMLGLSEAQEGVVMIMFRVAEKLETIADVRSALNDLLVNPETGYGYIDVRSIQTVQRKLLMLELEGADKFFGPTNFDVASLLPGTGVVNILQAQSLINESPVLYATFLLYLMNCMFSDMPEVGDTDKPSIVLFFDEAHLMFRDAPKSLLAMVERVVRLIRSKGVGVYFVSQSPADIPDAILAQLSNRIQHALRGYSVGERKALRAAAMSFRNNPSFNTMEVIQALGVGQALVSVLGADGAPTVVEKVGMVFIPIPADARPQIIRMRHLDRINQMAEAA